MVATNFGGCADREHGAVVQDVDARAHLHDESDVVLHQEDRHPFAGQRPQQRDEVASLVVAQSGGGLVEQQQARADGEGAAHFAQPNQSRGERVGPLVGDVPQPDSIENGLGVVGRVGVEIVGPPPADLGRDEDVLACGERPERFEVLERASDAEAGPLSRPGVRDVVLVEGERAAAALAAVR